jgi:hypothetical protein
MQYMCFVDVMLDNAKIMLTVLFDTIAGRLRRRSVEEDFFQPLAGGEEDFGLDDLETPDFTTRV